MSGLFQDRFIQRLIELERKMETIVRVVGRGASLIRSNEDVPVDVGGDFIGTIDGNFDVDAIGWIIFHSTGSHLDLLGETGVSLTSGAQIIIDADTGLYLQAAGPAEPVSITSNQGGVSVTAGDGSIFMTATGAAARSIHLDANGSVHLYTGAGAADGAFVNDEPISTRGDWIDLEPYLTANWVLPGFAGWRNGLWGRIANGKLELRGVLRNSTGAAVVSGTIATLPAAYRTATYPQAKIDGAPTVSTSGPYRHDYTPATGALTVTGGSGFAASIPNTGFVVIKLDVDLE